MIENLSSILILVVLALICFERIWGAGDRIDLLTDGEMFKTDCN